jgi:hypothetical protein
VTHFCHAHRCTRIIPPKLYMCLQHWNQLPKDIQAAIWRHYLPGQEKTKTPSLGYMAVHKLGVSHTAFDPNSPDGNAAATQYLAEALAWQKRAIDAGERDPLKGLIPE